MLTEQCWQENGSVYCSGLLLALEDNKQPELSTDVQSMRFIEMITCIMIVFIFIVNSYTLK